ncbi:MAG: NAD(P) transhydrogenase subunit alpha [Bradymonadia bacterium]|jgi:NAD(P) transhydrogenase subunit alpha
MDLFYEQAAEVDIVVTTALIPGRPAPKLWEARAVERMKPGSVVVDMAAQQGGNCELTVPGEAVVKHGVTLIGYTDLASRLATTASHLYGNNLVHLIKDMGGSPDGYHVDLDDVVVRGTLVLQDGAMMWPPPAIEPPKPAAQPKAAAQPEPVVAKPKAKTPAVTTKAVTTDAPAKSPWGSIVGLALVALWFVLRFWKGDGAPDAGSAAFVQHLTVFVLACFIGWQVVWSVTAALHTPLMSVTNAISGIIIVGGMLQAKVDPGGVALILGCLAVLFATINIAGGFLVTHRMLKMFRK